MQNLGVTLSTDNAIARNATISNYEFPVLMQNAFFLNCHSVDHVRICMRDPQQHRQKNQVAIYLKNMEIHLRFLQCLLNGLSKLFSDLRR